MPRNTDAHSPTGFRRLWLTFVNLAVLAATFWFVLYPAFTVTTEISDPEFRKTGMPSDIDRWHRAVVSAHARWATERIAEGRARGLQQGDISGTEWPMFSTVFLFWATEQLQARWEAGPKTSPEPRIVARPALDAGAALLVDPGNAHWVRVHWGPEYLDRENLFYRMLLVAGLDSHERLTGDTAHHELLRSQVQAFSAELDASPAGLLDDYPDECYPVDVLLAYASLARAMERLGMPNQPFIAHARRAFEGPTLDVATGLPAYFVDADTGEALSGARGVGNAAMLMWAPALWPDHAGGWYRRFHAQFWQQRWGFVGFREFPIRNRADPWLTGDVDSGPVIDGFGVAASAFGLAAARANGHPEHAVPLSAQALLFSWPTPDSRLLGPKLLSNLSDAPLTGEAALLFAWSRTSPATSAHDTEQPIPDGVWWVLSIAHGIGLLVTALCLRHLLSLWHVRLRRRV